MIFIEQHDGINIRLSLFFYSQQWRDANIYIDINTFFYEIDMDNYHPNILDLPDEILLIVCNEMSTIDVFHSFGNLNQRFDRLIADSLYTRHLEMTTLRYIKSEYDQIASIDPPILSDICVKIIPRIHHQVHQLTVQEDSIQQILHAASYPQLYSLSLINFHQEILYQYLKDDLILRDLLANQITHLNVDILQPADYFSEIPRNIYTLIISLCQNLTVLHFCDMFITRRCLTFVCLIPRASNICSTLVKLKVQVPTFFDCLHLLDGRLKSLSTLIITIKDISESMIYPDEDIQGSKLKVFSLKTLQDTYSYDDVVIPLLSRMINLEELQLYLRVRRMNSTYIDGIELYDQFLIHMTQLKKFTFYIKTSIWNKESEVELPSNEDIQRSFLGRNYQPVSSYVNIKLDKQDDECEIYSLPYDFPWYVDLDHSFQGGMFHKVRQLKMIDEVPFEYQLFQIISHDFSSLEFLTILNTHEMQEKQHSSPSITFPYLTYLDIKWTHLDYVELFLLRQNMHLPRLLKIRMEYKSLTIITNNFIDDAMSFNLERIEYLDIDRLLVYSEAFLRYFPLL